ncbi:hypothetical protein FRC05_007897 [Tulasnella sp. 425]|nr:hypothetical protein FRC05_007897 [Tulasnella sp. 425]
MALGVGTGFALLGSGHGSVSVSQPTLPRPSTSSSSGAYIQVQETETSTSSASYYHHHRESSTSATSTSQQQHPTYPRPRSPLPDRHIVVGGGYKTSSAAATTSVAHTPAAGLFSPPEPPRKLGILKPTRPSTLPLTLEISSRPTGGGKVVTETKVTLKDGEHVSDVHETVAVYNTSTGVSTSTGGTKSTVVFEDTQGHGISIGAGLAGVAIGRVIGAAGSSHGQMSLPTPPNSSIVISPSNSTYGTHTRDTSTTVVSPGRPVPETPGCGPSQHATQMGYGTMLGLPTPTSSHTLSAWELRLQVLFQVNRRIGSCMESLMKRTQASPAVLTRLLLLPELSATRPHRLPVPAMSTTRSSKESKI